MTGISFLLFLSISYMTFRFVRVFGTHQKLQVFFLAMTGVTMIGKIIYFATEMTWRLKNCFYTPTVWVEDTIFWFSDTAFTIAVVGNIFHWIFIRIRITKCHSPKQDLLYNNAGIGFVIWTILVGVIYAGILVQAWAFGQDDTRGSKTFILIYSVLFLFIAGIYFVAATSFYRSLKRVNEGRAKNMKCRIILSVFFISSSFLARGILTLLQYGFNIFEEIRTGAMRTQSCLLIATLFIIYICIDLLPTAYLCWSIRVAEHQKYDEIQTDLHLSNGSIIDPELQTAINNSDGDDDQWEDRPEIDETSFAQSTQS